MGFRMNPDLYAKSKFCFNGTFRGFDENMLIEINPQTDCPTKIITSSSFQKFIDENEQQLRSDLSPLQLHVIGLKKGYIV